VGALEVAKSAAPGSVVVTIFPDSGDKYLSERFWKRASQCKGAEYVWRSRLRRQFSNNCGSMEKKLIRTSAAAFCLVSFRIRAIGRFNPLRDAATHAQIRHRILSH